MTFIFPYSWNFIIPVDAHIFQRGSNHQLEIDGYGGKANNKIQKVSIHHYIKMHVFKDFEKVPICVQNKIIPVDKVFSQCRAPV